MSAGDAPPEVTIKVRRDGPLKVSGPVRLVDHDGLVISAAGDELVLCRCGRSAVKPFCDGSHRLGFDGTSACPHSS
ncbi:MAG: CDGSH iron-sulfur domain-containing protein [Actinobacteria bacterium]|nr:CDGSH iron-sulfur domain-containing protein [Actinomycetota bacterium]